MELRSAAVLVSLLAALLGGVTGYYSNQFKVPNGDRVPHPCKPNYSWRGLGHESEQGGGNLNPFGQLFRSEGQKWTQKLCEADSDGDGRSNGEELGDPQCVWREGDPPPSTPSLSHPGVCQPMDSPDCAARNSWVDCSYQELSCPALHQSDVRNLTLRLSRTAVPPQETTYTCQLFRFPAHQDVHLVALTPNIDNHDVMHHILLYGCTEDPEEEVPRDRPFRCGMGMRGCSSLLGGWTVGHPGSCLHPQAGFRLGRTGYRTLLLEFHWNNPQLREGTTDASGLTLHYTAELRPFDAGLLWAGQTFLQLAPGRRQVAVEGSCPAPCTRQLLSQPVHVIAALNHMHYLGIRQKVEILRGDQVITLNEDDPYSYDRPQWREFSQPVQLLPGDALRTECVYSTLSRNRTTFFGEATSDEMCFAFLTFFPLNASLSQYCTAWRGISQCEEEAGLYRGCNFREFLLGLDPAREELFRGVEWGCRGGEGGEGGGLAGPCLQECREAVDKARQHPCLQGDALHFLSRRLQHDAQGLLFLKRLQMCPENTCARQQEPDVGTLASGKAAASVSPPGWALLPVAILLSCLLLLPAAAPRT